ncbi:MAG: L,D-transpeptidase family protein [Phycisphaerae bacterium]|nr:L,D-transpeptidase family protein [Phycisphaerae bacterium]
MAISSYGHYRNQRRKRIIYYVAAVVVVAFAAVIFFYPSGNKKEADEIQSPAVEQTPVTKEAAVKEQTVVQSQIEPAANLGQMVPEANGIAGSRIAALLQDAGKCIEDGRIIAARNTLNDVLNMAMDNSLREQVKRQMQMLTEKWLFSKTVEFGDNLCSVYKVQAGDMLSSIGASNKIPYQFIMKINNIPSERSLRAGQSIKIVQGPFHGIIYLSSFTMDLYLQNVYVKSYKVGIGKEGHETPPGLWRAKIGGKLIKPIWTDPETGKTYQPDAPDYPLGSGWIALEGIDSRTRDVTGIAIHGTKDETTIGTKSSQGCIRLYNGELTELYDMFEQGFSELRIVE